MADVWLIVVVVVARCRRFDRGQKLFSISSTSTPSSLTVIEPASVGADPRSSHVEPAGGQELDHGHQRPWAVRGVDGDDGRRGSGDVVDRNLRGGNSQGQGLVLEQRRRGKLRAHGGRRATVVAAGVGVVVVGLRGRRAVVLASAGPSPDVAAGAAAPLFGRRQDSIAGAGAASCASSWPRLRLCGPVRVERRQWPPAVVISAEVEHSALKRRENWPKSLSSKLVFFRRDVRRPLDFFFAFFSTRFLISFSFVCKCAGGNSVIHSLGWLSGGRSGGGGGGGGQRG